MFNKILVANRGEIAIRIMRACREIGITTAAVYSDADRLALHVTYADETYHIGPSPSKESYLAIDKIIETARRCGADAIHPGYGFLAENADFAAACEASGIVFIGPRSESIRRMGNKLEARRTMKTSGVPVIPGDDEPIRSPAAAAASARELTYPVMIKAAAGGGGKGMRVVRDEREFGRALEMTMGEAESAFGDSSVYIEKFIERPKHIEFQVLADGKGKVWTLGERECSLQRRHQKVMEEAPSPSMTPELRQEIGDVVRKAVRETGYRSLGTLEFIMDEDKKLYFLEMNTRVQVEHPVTEMATGLDLVALQIRVAAGEEVDLPDTRPWSFRGHAIECRVNAEDPKTFAPWPGLISEYHPPGGAGVRVDSGVYGGWKVPSDYDSLIAKLIVHAPTRAEAIVRMRRALGEFIVGGIRTNIALHKRLLEDADVLDGTMTTRTIEQVLAADAARAAAEGPSSS